MNDQSRNADTPICYHLPLINIIEDMLAANEFRAGALTGDGREVFGITLIVSRWGT